MSPEDLIGHVLGLLDAVEHRMIEQCAQSDEAARGQIEVWRRRLAVLEVDRMHLESPSGLAVRTCQRVRLLLERESSDPEP